MGAVDEEICIWEGGRGKGSFYTFSLDDDLDTADENTGQDSEARDGTVHNQLPLFTVDCLEMQRGGDRENVWSKLAKYVDRWKRGERVEGICVAEGNLHSHVGRGHEILNGI